MECPRRTGMWPGSPASHKSPGPTSNLPIEQATPAQTYPVTPTTSQCTHSESNGLDPKCAEGLKLGPVTTQEPVDNENALR